MEVIPFFPHENLPTTLANISNMETNIKVSMCHGGNSLGVFSLHRVVKPKAFLWKSSN